MPGYTGFVPSRQDRFGATAGDIKREILSDGGYSPKAMKTIDASTRFFSPVDKRQEKRNLMVYGNMSRAAPNWIGGPTHVAKNCFIPGYTGHIKGIISENVFGSSLGKTSARALERKHAIGARLQPKERFRSEYNLQFRNKNFRRYGKYSKIINCFSVADPNSQPRKDYDDYLRFVKDLAPKNQDTIDSTEELPAPKTPQPPTMARTMSTIDAP